jgi:hypothetical protein
MINAIAVRKKISWYSVGIKQQMKYQGIVAMIANLFNQANRFFRFCDSNSPQDYGLNINKIALNISILMYALNFIYMLLLLVGDIPNNISGSDTNNILIDRSIGGWKNDN